MIPVLGFPHREAVKDDFETGDHNTLTPFRTTHRSLPIISGLLCPFSVLLEIPGLTERWYIRTDGINIIEVQDNSVLLEIGLAISMLLGVLANTALIIRYLEKRVYASTLIAIIALTLHHVINITTIIVFILSHSADDGFTRGQAFWITMTSTVVSSICNITLVIDFLITKDFAKHGSGLSSKQKSLVIAVMGLMCYIALGSLVFSLLLHLTYINSLYFTICTITSVGFGDLTPTTLSSKIFSFPYNLGGLIYLAFTISIGRETIIESESVGEVVVVGGGGVQVEGVVAKMQSTSIIEPIVPHQIIIETPLEVIVEDNNQQDYQPKLKEEEEEDHHNKLEKDLIQEQKKEFQSKISISLFLFFTFWFIGAGIFTYTETWNYFESLYFCFIFFTTIGYGDYSPKTSAGRTFFIFWSILGVATMTLLLSVITESFSSRYRTSISESKFYDHSHDHDHDHTSSSNGSNYLHPSHSTYNNNQHQHQYQEHQHQHHHQQQHEVEHRLLLSNNTLKIQLLGLEQEIKRLNLKIVFLESKLFTEGGGGGADERDGKVENRKSRRRRGSI